MSPEDFGRQEARKGRPITREQAEAAARILCAEPGDDSWAVAS